ARRRTRGPVRRPGRASSSRREGPRPRARTLQLGGRGRADRRDLRQGDRRASRGEERMLTVDFDRLGVVPGMRALDIGAGAGRHSFELYRRGADVVAFDQNADDMKAVADMFVATEREGDVSDGTLARAEVGAALALPYDDATFDLVLISEVLEHVPEDERAIAELVRVLKPGGVAAVTVPRWFPEKICWALSDAYHEVEGGHIRIYKADELAAKLTAAGLTVDRKSTR